MMGIRGLLQDVEYVYHLLDAISVDPITMGTGGVATLLVNGY